MELELEVRSPLHVGTGEEITREEFLFENGTAYAPDITKYFEDHPDKIDAFVDRVERGQQFVFQDIAQYSRYAIDLWTTKDAIGKKIQTILKNAADEPYIPGSSLKGAIRTALACYALNNEQEVNNFTESAVKELFRPETDNPKGDLLRCLTVRDSEPVDPNDSLVLGEIKTYSLKKDGKMKREDWPNHAELLRPGTRLTTEISVNEDLLDRMIETESGRRQAEAVLGEGLTEESVRERIAEALKAFERATFEEERTLTGDFSGIEAFYTGFTSGPPRLRLGAGTSYYSTTVASALSDAERRSIRVKNCLGKGPYHDDCGEDLTPDDHNSGKLFCYGCYTGNIDPQSDEVVLPPVPFPKTRRLVLRNGEPEYPLGWVDIPNLSF